MARDAGIADKFLFEKEGPSGDHPFLSKQKGTQRRWATRGTATITSNIIQAAKPPYLCCVFDDNDKCVWVFPRLPRTFTKLLRRDVADRCELAQEAQKGAVVVALLQQAKLQVLFERRGGHFHGKLVRQQLRGRLVILGKGRVGRR